MSVLTLYPATTDRAAPPVAAGDTVHVPHAVPCPSGQAIRAGHYTVVDARWHDAPDWRGRPAGWRLLIETPLDCSGIGERYQPPTREAIDRAFYAGEPRPAVPIAAQRKRVWLCAGDFTHYDPTTTDGRHPATIPDRL